MMISRELPPCRLRVCRDFIPPAFLDHDLMVRLWVLCPCAQFRERHHFGWADGSSAIHLLQCIALAVSTRPIQWRAQLGKNPRDGRRLLFTGHLVGTARSRGRVLPKRLSFSRQICELSMGVHG